MDPPASSKMRRILIRAVMVTITSAIVLGPLLDILVKSQEDNTSQSWTDTTTGPTHMTTSHSTVSSDRPSTTQQPPTTAPHPSGEKRYKCVMENNNFVMLRRVDDTLDFDRNWTDYKREFRQGDNYWLGLELIHLLTSNWKYGLRVNATYWDGIQGWAEYDFFYVGGENEKYRLFVVGYNPNSTLQDALINTPRNVCI